jgi:hypothetical protein
MAGSDDLRSSTSDGRIFVFHPLLKFKLGYYQIVTRRLPEFSAQKAALEAHQNEQRLSRRPIPVRRDIDRNSSDGTARR